MDPALPLGAGSDRHLSDPPRTASIVDGVSFDIAAGEVLGIVGESAAVNRSPRCRYCAWSSACRIAGGAILFEGHDLVAASEGTMTGLRGAAISMIFQEPMSSLKPRVPDWRPDHGALRQHRGMDRAACAAGRARIARLGRDPDAKRRIDEYPHQLSGGMRQRVMIAIALACRPKLLTRTSPRPPSTSRSSPDPRSAGRAPARARHGRPADYP